jgi:Meiotically up-regulated gene 113
MFNFVYFVYFAAPLESFPFPSRSKPLIYFIQSPEGDQIKIGTTLRMARRLRQLIRLRGTKLRVLAIVPGDHAREAELHRQFGHLRMEGEWFDPGPDLLKFIRDHGRPWKGTTEESETQREDAPLVDVLSKPSAWEEQPIEINPLKLYSIPLPNKEWKTLDGMDLIEFFTRPYRFQNQAQKRPKVKRPPCP